MAEKGQCLVTFDIDWASRICLFVVMGWTRSLASHQAQAPLYPVGECLTRHLILFNVETQLSPR